MKRRAISLGVVVAILVAATIGARIWQRNHYSAPFEFDPLRGTVNVNIRVDSDTMVFTIDTLYPRTLVLAKVADKIRAHQNDLEPFNSSAIFALAGYSHRQFFDIARDGSLPPGVDGILGNDFFQTYAGVNGEGRREGVRLTFDFKGRALTIDTSPGRRLVLPSTDVHVLDYSQNTEGNMVVSLGLNYGQMCVFELGIGHPDIVLPTGKVLEIAGDLSSYEHYIGRVPVTLQIDSEDATSIAISPPGESKVGTLGVSLLSNYLTSIDFKHHQLILERRR